MTIRRWQDWVNLFLGMWLFVSPLALGLVIGSPAATWNACVLGLAIIAFAWGAVYIPRAWTEAINIILGLWLMASPWILGFELQTVARTTTVATGLLLMALATWAMVLDTDLRRWLHEHHWIR